VISNSPRDAENDRDEARVLPQPRILAREIHDEAPREVGPLAADDAAIPVRVANTLARSDVTGFLRTSRAGSVQQLLPRCGFRPAIQTDDVVRGLVLRGNLDQTSPPPWPTPLSAHPDIRPLFVEHAVVLVLLETPLPLHQAEAAGCSSV